MRKPISKWTSLTATILTTLAPFSHAGAALESVTISSEDKFPAPRWMYEAPGKKTHGAKESSAVVNRLAEVKSAQMEGNSDECLAKITAVRGQAKSLDAWLALAEADCATKLKPSKAHADKLAQVLGRVTSNPLWIVNGPQVAQLKTVIAEGYLALIDQDIKGNQARAWKSIESAQNYLASMDNKSRARLWRSAGELAFLQQKPEAARDFIRRSLAEQGSEELRSRLASIAAAIETPAKVPALKEAAPAKPSDAPATAVEISKEETELVDRVTAALKAGDLISAVSDALTIISDFPGSQRAKWASDRALDIYLSMVDKTDPKYSSIREKIMKTMLAADSDRLSDWSRSMYGRGQYADAFLFAGRALDRLTGSRRTAVLDLAAKAAMACDRFQDARELSIELSNRDAGTRESREALFRLGLLAYRSAQYQQAVSYFEKVITLPNSESLEVLGRYWMWRSLQKLNSDRAASVGDELSKRFPFTYYGLRARYEKNGNVLEWTSDSAKIESTIYMTSNERMAWERTQLLLRAGWLDEAQAELKLLPLPLKADDKAVRALLWAASGQYTMASKLLNDAWDEKGTLRSTPFVAAAFPSEFDEWITEQAKARHLDRALVKGLIKQESSYNAKAISSANAVGLMQMIPPTAKEIANDLRLGALDLPNDLFQPKKNIQLGTFYLARLLTKYQQSAPLALAAYNAGPGRMDRWLRSRPSLRGLASLKSSAPDDEIWIDEIPYAETSFYVKSILRNLLIYKMLDKGRVEVQNPLWLNAD